MIIVDIVIKFINFFLGIFINLKKNDKVVEQKTQEVGQNAPPSADKLEDRINRGPRLPPGAH